MEAIAKIEMENSSKGLEQPVFRFAQINDIHLRTGNDIHRTREKFYSVLKDLQYGIRNPKPDLLIVAGDLAFDSTQAGMQQIDGEVSDAIGEVAEKLKELEGIDLLSLPGNHDFNIESEDAQKPWVEHFGFDVRNYAYDHKGILFILLDNSNADRNSNDDIVNRNKWFENILEQNPYQPKIIITHVPLIPMRDSEILRESFGGDNYVNLDREKKLQKLIERNRKSVIAVLCGHLHLSGSAEVNGVNYICASGLESWPCDYLYFEVYKDRICGQLISADESVWNRENKIPAKRNGIHDRHGDSRNFTDSEHETFETYLRGNDFERVFDFPLLPHTNFQKKQSLVARKTNGLPTPNIRCFQINDNQICMENLSDKTVITKIPVPESISSWCFIQKEGSESFFLTTEGKKQWSMKNLNKGIPVEIPAWDSFSIIFSEKSPGETAELIKTSGLMEIETELNNPSLIQ